MGYDAGRQKLQSKNGNGVPLPASSTAFLPGGTGRSLLCCYAAWGKPCRAEAGGKTLDGKRAATAGACYSRPALSGRAGEQQKTPKQKQPADRSTKATLSRTQPPAISKENGISSCRAIKALQAEIEKPYPRKTAATTIAGQNGRNTAAYRLSGQYRPDFTQGTQACEKEAGTGAIKTAPNARTHLNKGLPVPYPQYQGF